MHRRHTRVLTAATALSAVALALGAPTAATAQTWNHADPAGDVVKYTFDTDTFEESHTGDPSVTNGDVISSTIKHNPRKVIATLRFRDLAVTHEDLTIFAMSIRTDKGNRDMTVAAMKGHERGVRDFSRPDGHSVRCRGASHHIDYAAHTVSVVVPRSCLGRPRWVKVSAGAVRVPSDLGVVLTRTSRTSGGASPARLAAAARDALAARSARVGAAPAPEVFVAHADDALSTTAGENLTYSPRLRRG